ncbi:MAG: hypothetical protein KGL95_05335 [Patescibacteria group bacterium]|nr:hypothetical protein [Patescibacteria group bacterium]
MNELKIWFTTTTDNLETLRKDFADLKKLTGLPCEMNDEFFSAYTNPRYSKAIAVAFYVEEDVKRGYPNVEANEEYFKMESYARKLVLLHELIHACQRFNELKIINEKYFVRGIKDLEQIEASYSDTHGTSDAWIPTLKGRTKIIDLFTSWIFEMWAEMLFKEKYSKHFEYRMEVTYGNIASQYKRNAYSDDGWAMFLIFAQLVRAYYMMKISQGLDISEKYKELYENWRIELSECASDEYDDLMARLEPLTEISAYDKSNPSILEKPYDEFIKIMKDSSTIFSL